MRPIERPQTRTIRAPVDSMTASRVGRGAVAWWCRVERRPLLAGRIPNVRRIRDTTPVARGVAGRYVRRAAPDTLVGVAPPLPLMHARGVVSAAAGPDAAAAQTTLHLERSPGYPLYGAPLSAPKQSSHMKPEAALPLPHLVHRPEAYRRSHSSMHASWMCGSPGDRPFQQNRHIPIAMYPPHIRGTGRCPRRSTRRAGVSTRRAPCLTVAGRTPRGQSPARCRRTRGVPPPYLKCIWCGAVFNTKTGRAQYCRIKNKYTCKPYMSCRPAAIATRTSRRER